MRVRRHRAGKTLEGDIAERRQLRIARLRRQRLLRQHQCLQRAARPFLHDGRQPRQFDRQPGAVGGGLCAVREYRRPGPDDLLLHCRRRARVDVVALAHRGALESPIYNRAMNDELPDIQTSSASGEAGHQADGGPVPAKKKLGKAAAARAAIAAMEARIGHQFADTGLLTTAITHVSALKSSRKRGDSYQRLQFLWGHLLRPGGPDMLDRGDPKADEGEPSKRLADLVRWEGCAEGAKTLGLPGDMH